MKEKIPIDFVRKFMKARGWKFLHEVWCDCELLNFVETSHPIKWLYNHIKQGHEPAFDVCHCWNVNRHWEIEEWYRWFTFQWNKEAQNWEMITCYSGCEGFENDDEPHIRRSWNGSIGLDVKEVELCRIP